MNFSDKMKQEPLPFEDIDEEVDNEPISLLEAFGIHRKTDEEKTQEATEILNRKLEIFMKLNDRLRDEYGIEDKDERYRILEILICV